VKQDTQGLSATSDARGAFRFCAVPLDQSVVTAQATKDGRSSDPTRVDVHPETRGGVVTLFVRAAETPDR
jgi:hypothetical protein